MSEEPNPKKPRIDFDIGFAERIMEGNWEWMRAEGFRPYQTLPQDELEYSQYRQFEDRFGEDNVKQGDVYDADSDRPLRHIPGLTVYIREQPDQ